MKKFMLVAASTALLAACGEDKTEQQPAANVEASKQQILTYIPADTPMLFTSGLSPDQYPERYLKVMESQMEGVVKYLNVMMGQAFKEVENYAAEPALDENGEVVAAEASKVAEMKQKASSFVDRWFMQDNFAKVGMKVGETQMVGYMVDLFPVVRLKLSDGHQVQAMLDDLEQQFEVPFIKSEVDGSQVREIQADDITILISTQDDYLVISGAPTVIKDQMIGQLIGSTKPTRSMADDPSLMQQVKKSHGYVLDDILVLDFQQIADNFINPAQHNSALVNFMQIEDNMLSPACKTEITAMIAKAPRMVGGSKKLTNDSINGSFVWEMDSALAADLATLAGRIPHGNSDAAMTMGMSFDIVNAKNLASKYIDQIVSQPYACELLLQMNQQAAELQAKLSQPLPPFVGNFKGFSFSLDELKLNMEAAQAANPNPKDMIESLKTQVYLAVDETEALLGMAQMMVPQLQGMEIKTDGSLITLADKVPMISGKDIPIDIANLYAAISSNTIGLSMGHEGGGSLSEKVNEPGTEALMTFSASADGYKNLMEQIFSMAEIPGMPEEIKKELNMQKDLALGMLYWKSQNMSMNFTDQGFSTEVDIKY
ncbi:hypothetical protein MNBD_GAMMA02-969 [hydrothermal vent metagenome]|uniref:DUF3352 domain-containing protein n=1 Tax=hydrothermal vent metagenome TaxID=652676 RepID=A0A3B0W3B4_9ZZZZ